MSEAAGNSRKLQTQLAETTMGLLDSVAAERSKYYQEHEDKVPTEQDVQAIVSRYATANMTISGGIGLISGPWGMAAAVPEIALVLRKQIAMIYDLGMAYGKGHVLSRELLAGVMLSALGAGGGTLLTMHAGKILVKRASLRVMQRAVALMAGKVTQQLIKSMVGKWLPVVGAAAMAAWSRYTTHRVGKKAIEIFEKPIEYSEEEADAPTSVETDQTGAAPDAGYDELKIKSLVNLMKVDRQIRPEEREYVGALIQGAGISGSKKAELLSAMDADTKLAVDYTAFADAPDEAVGLLTDLVALSRRDGHQHVSERMYIKQVGKLVGFSDSDIDEATASA